MADDESFIPSETTEVEGHGPVARAKPDRGDALGTEGRTSTTRADARSTGEDDELDVQGHMHPELARGHSAARHQDMLAEADRARLANSAKTAEHDSGVVDRVRRLIRRDEA